MDKTSKIPIYLFDRKDYDLIKIVNDVLARKRFTRRQYFPYFHPNGINEMAETKGLRTAYAVAELLTSLEVGGVDDRLKALRSLRLEAIETAGGPMPKNTGRVLLQIMKDLVRAYGNERRQLELAHDFRLAASGKPGLVRRLLRRFHLLEMPEQWNQLAFDDHVHDVNTKGRKSSTHLIMDAWIKGIRRLRVIHYNFIEPRFAAELFEAAKILDIDVRIGIEFYASFRGRYVQLIWVPRGFADSQSFLCFLEEPDVRTLMDAGRSASRYQQEYVLHLLRSFNENHLKDLNRRLGLDIPEIGEGEFLSFVGIGQKSKLHLSKFIHNKVMEVIGNAPAKSRKGPETDEPARKRRTNERIEELSLLDVEDLIDDYLTQIKNPGVKFPDRPDNDPAAPELLRLSPFEILSRLSSLRTGYRVTLNLTDLKVEDVLELLYDCQGMITRIEIFNLKDFCEGKVPELAETIRLMRAINEGSVINLKQIIREMIAKMPENASQEKAEQTEKLLSILYDIDSLKSYYFGKSLKPRIGSDSTGRSPRLHGMGLAVMDTLPARARKEIKDASSGARYDIIPIYVPAYRNLSFTPQTRGSSHGRFSRMLAASWPWGYFFAGFEETWQVDTRHPSTRHPGNIVTLGGVKKKAPDRPLPGAVEGEKNTLHISHVNSRLKNTLKIIIGFVPAFASFALTKDWWLLAYGGAFLWFAITGLRNVLQSVLGGGGIKRSPLLNWSDYISWTRITDSLMYTGFSVPLLDYLVKRVILDNGLGITTASSPLLLYSFMALANGIYLSSHNIIRGLSRETVYANFFRTVISIPLAIAINGAAGGIINYFGVTNGDAALQKWAAIISKTASDTVAGFIEGLADRRQNIIKRIRDYKVKFDQLFDIYAELELIYPEVQPFAVLQHSTQMKRKPGLEAQDLEKIIMVHALDLLYFWMYQPRARTALRQFVRRLSEDERQVLASSQFILHRHKEISQLFIDGILGDNFPKPLSFYLSRSGEYLEAIKKLLFTEEAAGTP